jgi:hypothetical protein
METKNENIGRIIDREMYPQKCHEDPPSPSQRNYKDHSFVCVYVCVCFFFFWWCWDLNSGLHICYKDHSFSILQG